MSVFYGYEEVNADGLKLVPGKVYGTPFKNLGELTPDRTRQLLLEGYTTVRLETAPTNVNPVDLPLNIASASAKVTHELGMGKGANFVLQTADGQTRYAILNGFVYDLQGSKPALFHGLVL
jgi:hypothetical protein